MKIKFIGILFLLTTIIAGCSKDSPSEFSEKSATIDNVYENENTKDEKQLTPVPQQPKPNNTQQQSNLSDEEIKQIGKKVIKTAELSIQTKDFDKTVNRIKDTLKKYECFISSETQNSYSSSITSTLTIKVKSDQFDNLLKSILTGEDKILSKNIYVTDVTEEYVDLYARLKNKKLTEEQYQQILKKANTVSEILNVQEYLSRIREEIEATQGRMKFIDYKVQYSTITITITYYGTDVYEPTFWDKILEGLQAGWRAVIYFVIALFYLWPLWIVTAIVLFIIRRNKKKKQKIQ